MNVIQLPVKRVVKQENYSLHCVFKENNVSEYWIVNNQTKTVHSKHKFLCDARKDIKILERFEKHGKKLL